MFIFRFKFKQLIGSPFFTGGKFESLSGGSFGELSQLMYKKKFVNSSVFFTVSIGERGFEWFGGGTQYIRVSKSSYVTK